MDPGNWMQPEMLRELSAATAAASGNLAQKRFIMFDKSGDKGRIMFSPNVFYEFPSLAADEQNANINNNNINNNSFQHVYREAMASFTALQSMRERNRPYSITLCDIGDFGGAATTNNDSDSSSSKLSWDRTSNHHQGSSVIHEENSEDIDALLYSDDEEEEEECCSTGHSPSEVTSDEGDEAASGFTGGNFDDDEGSGEGIPKLIDSGATAAAAAAAVSSSEKMFIKSRFSSVSKLTQMKKTKKKKQRKDKIRQTVKMLQSLIPGGDDLDPAIVLDEAIHYMKALQMKVVQLEATRQAKL